MDGYKRDLRRAYDVDTARRDRRLPESWRLDIVDWFADRVRRQATTARVLELGCGTGQLARRLVEAELDVTAVDLSQANAQRTVARGVPAVVTDFARIPFRTGTFTAAFAFNALLHVPRAVLPHQFTEIRRVLSPDALLLVVTWGGRTADGPLPGEWLDPPRYFSLLDDRAFVTLPTPGFDRVEATAAARAPVRRAASTGPASCRPLRTMVARQTCCCSA